MGGGGGEDSNLVTEWVQPLLLGEVWGGLWKGQATQDLKLLPHHPVQCHSELSHKDEGVGLWSVTCSS